MSNLYVRTLTGAGIVAVLIAGIAINEFTFMAVFLAILLGGLWEFYRIFEQSGKSPQKTEGMLLGSFLFFANYGIVTGSNLRALFLILLVASILYIFIAELYRKKENPFENLAITFFGVFYIAVPLSLLWYIGFRENIYHYNNNLILSIFFLIWTYDSMAYLTGMAFGKRKLFERISPKKSWEGAIGGLIFCLIISVVLYYVFDNLTLWQWLIFGVLVAVFGTYGDLAESMLKRSAGIKDSGSILPGHGGILDRFDAIFLAIPAVYLYLHFI